MHKFHRKRHQQSHIKPFSCDICGTRLAVKRLLVRHITKSEYKCSKCLKKFKSQYNLQDHNLRTHGKQIKCDKSDAEFHAHYLLLRHVQKHHEAKRWHCSYPGCMIKFTGRTAARTHLRKVHKLETADKKEVFLKCCKMLILQ